MNRGSLIALLAALALTPGCRSISNSVSGAWTISKGAIGGVSESLSGSNPSAGSGLDEPRLYQYDISILTESFARDGGSEVEYLRTLGQIAELHGVSHWAGLPGTLRGIGLGLQRAGLEEAEIDGFLGRVGLADEADRLLVLEGYHSMLL
jgi:hypothetical protein